MVRRRVDNLPITITRDDQPKRSSNINDGVFDARQRCQAIPADEHEVRCKQVVADALKGVSEHASDGRG